MLRLPVLLIQVCLTLTATAQRIDSVMVFRAIPDKAYTTSNAETTAWQLLRSRSDFAVIGGVELEEINKALAEGVPEKHEHMALPTLTHLGFAYMGRSAHVFCLADDLEQVIDLTVRRQFRIDGWTDRARLKALLVTLGL